MYGSDRRGKQDYRFIVRHASGVTSRTGSWSPDSATGKALSTVRSLEARGMPSRVLIVNVTTRMVLFEWHGEGASGDYPEAGWTRACRADTRYTHGEVPATTVIETGYDDGPVPACAACAAALAARQGNQPS